MPDDSVQKLCCVWPVVPHCKKANTEAEVQVCFALLEVQEECESQGPQGSESRAYVAYVRPLSFLALVFGVLLALSALFSTVVPEWSVRNLIPSRRFGICSCEHKRARHPQAQHAERHRCAICKSVKAGVRAVGSKCWKCRQNGAKDDEACDGCGKIMLTYKTQAGEQEGRCCEKCTTQWKLARGVPVYNFDCTGPPLVAFAETVSLDVAVDFYIITFPVEKNGYRRKQRKKWCLLIVMRIVLWIRFGWACGILASPPVEAYGNAPALADFFGSQHWPDPARACPVLLVGVAPALKANIKARMVSADRAAAAEMVRSTELTASRRNVCKNFRLSHFVENAKAYDRTPMVKRAAALGVAAGLVSSVGAAFKRSPQQIVGSPLSGILYPH